LKPAVNGTALPTWMIGLSWKNFSKELAANSKLIGEFLKSGLWSGFYRIFCLQTVFYNKF
jgi:hypothetical protein